MSIALPSFQHRGGAFWEHELAVFTECGSDVGHLEGCRRMGHPRAAKLSPGMSAGAPWGTGRAPASASWASRRTSSLTGWLDSAEILVAAKPGSAVSARTSDPHRGEIGEVEPAHFCGARDAPGREIICRTPWSAHVPDHSSAKPVFRDTRRSAHEQWCPRNSVPISSPSQRAPYERPGRSRWNR